MAEDKDEIYLSKDGVAQAMGASLPTVTNWLNAIKLRESLAKAAGEEWQSPVIQWGGNGKSYQIDQDRLKSWLKEIEDAKAEEEAKVQNAIAESQADLDLEGGDVEGEAALTARTRTQFATAILAEMRVKKERGELIEANRVQAENEELFKYLVTQLQGLPDHLQRQCDLGPEAVVVLQEKVDEIQEELARQLMSMDDLNAERVGENTPSH